MTFGPAPVLPVVSYPLDSRPQVFDFALELVQTTKNVV
jgi:hypothetical protein